jgi:hypothetical protein
MSNIFLFFQKKIFYSNSNYISKFKPNNNQISLNKNNIDYTKNFPPANSEWSNSIYAYNKKTTRHLPITDKMVIKLIKSYFYFFSPKYENKISSIKLRIRLRRLSINRIFVSKADLKHTSTKVIITLYIYNRQKKYFLNKLKLLNKIGRGSKNNYILKKLKKIKLEGIKIINLINKEKNLFTEILEWGLDSFKNIEERHYEDFIQKSLEKEMLKVYYKNLLYFNKSKFENTYLLKLKTLISQIYKKKVEFNIVNLEYLHLNSDILSESIVIKLRNRKNRLLRILKTSLNMVKLPYIDKLNVKHDLNKIKLEKMLLFNNIQNLNTLIQIYVNKNEDGPKDGFNELLLKIFPFFIFANMKNIEEKGKDIEKNILNSIDNKSISGIRLEATGRLSRRFTAAKSIFKFKYKGSLKNIHSSYKGLSTVILRGHVKSNVQYSNINSKTRNGSFGIKGWVSSI